MQMLLACPHHKPTRQGLLSSFPPVEKGVYVPKVTPALVLRPWPYHKYTPALLAHWAQRVGLARKQATGSLSLENAEDVSLERSETDTVPPFKETSRVVGYKEWFP